MMETRSPVRPSVRYCIWPDSAASIRFRADEPTRAAVVARNSRRSIAHLACQVNLSTVRGSNAAHGIAAIERRILARRMDQALSSNNLTCNKHPRLTSLTEELSA